MALPSKIGTSPFSASSRFIGSVIGHLFRQLCSEAFQRIAISRCRGVDRNAQRLADLGKCQSAPDLHHDDFLLLGGQRPERGLSIAACRSDRSSDARKCRGLSRLNGATLHARGVVARRGLSPLPTSARRNRDTPVDPELSTESSRSERTRSGRHPGHQRRWPTTAVRRARARLHAAPTSRATHLLRWPVASPRIMDADRRLNCLIGSGKTTRDMNG